MFIYVHHAQKPIPILPAQYRSKKPNRGNRRIIVFPSSKKYLGGSSSIYYPRNRKHNDKSDRSRSQ